MCDLFLEFCLLFFFWLVFTFNTFFGLVFVFFLHILTQEETMAALTNTNLLAFVVLVGIVSFKLDPFRRNLRVEDRVAFLQVVGVSGTSGKGRGTVGALMAVERW